MQVGEDCSLAVCDSGCHPLTASMTYDSATQTAVEQIGAHAEPERVSVGRR